MKNLVIVSLMLLLVGIAFVIGGGWFVSEYNGAAFLALIGFFIVYLGLCGLISSIILLIMSGIDKSKEKRPQDQVIIKKTEQKQST